MNKDQADFLNQKLETLSVIQPSILVLRKRLLSIGGIQLVAPMKPDPDLKNILEYGLLQKAEVIVEEMEMNGCHWNVAALWLQPTRSLTAIGTGYALSDDGLWRQHSWGIQPDAIIETTEGRTHYYGLKLYSGDADEFAARHSDT